MGGKEGINQTSTNESKSSTSNMFSTVSDKNAETYAQICDYMIGLIS